MPKPLDKSEKIDVYLTAAQKLIIKNLADLQKQSMSEFVAETVLNTSTQKPKNDDNHELLILLEKHFSEVHEFQNQQQETMYIIMQFIMLLMRQHKSIDEIMAFYDDASKKAKKKFSEGN